MGTKQAMFDAARRIEAAGTGYDQSQRWSFLNIAARTIKACIRTAAAPWPPDDSPSSIWPGATSR